MFGKLRVVLILLLGTAFGSEVRASPLKEPRRMVNGQAADLTPLFHWWTNHDGNRPLTAWVHVTGSIVGTNTWGWVVQGEIEKTAQTLTRTPASSAGGRIILRNPPLQDRIEFETWSAQLKSLEEQRAKVAGLESQAKKSLQSIGHGRSYRAQHQQLQQTETEARAELRPLDQQIKDLKGRLASYPPGEHYSLDCFALDTGQAYGGVPLLDHGAGFR